MKFVLARFKRKHIFANGTLPDEQLVCDSVSQFARHMKWRWHFQGSERSSPMWKSGVRTPPPPPTTVFQNSAVCAFLAKLEADVLSATRRSLRIATENRHVWTKSVPSDCMEFEVDVISGVHGDAQRQGAWVHFGFCAICPFISPIHSLQNPVMLRLTLIFGLREQC